MQTNMDEVEIIAKRQKLDSSNDNKVLIKAQNLLRLNFIHTGTSVITQKSSEVEPEFTHQVFDDEQLECYESEKDGQVIITVDCLSLSHSVKFSHHFSNSTQHYILDRLAKALPSNQESTENVAPCDNIPNCNPPGQLLHSFIDKAGVHFEVWRATAKDTGATELLQRAEKLAIWFIETADSVDFADDRWEVIFLYSLNTTDTACVDASTVTSSPLHREFVGYMTLFSFRNPILGTKLRVCQALILPHWQGKGLGRSLLLSVYTHIVQAREEVVELTVEDPAPGFQRLRDAVDFELLLNHFPAILQSPVGTCSSPPPGESSIAKTLKIVKAQAQFLEECIAFLSILREVVLSLQDSPSLTTTTTTTTDSTDNEECTTSTNTIKMRLDSHSDFKAFRLKVKRRILRSDKDLASLQPKSAMQQALGEEFDLQLERFLALHKTAMRLKLLPW